MTVKKINQGFITEANHYDKLVMSFGKGNVSAPKNSGGGSDFIVNTSNGIVTFESKTSNTDIYDAGVVNMFSNGYMFFASPFLSNTHIEQMEKWVSNNIDGVKQYCEAASTDRLPHSIHKDTFNQIKGDNKLIHIMEKEPLRGIVEASFIKSHNKFAKANYIIIGESVYCVSNEAHMNPLNLPAPVLDDDDINYTSIRTARSGSRDDGMCSVTLRVQYKMHKEVKESSVTLDSLNT